MPVSQISQAVDDEFIIQCCCEFLFEKWSYPGPSFLSRREFEMPDCRREHLASPQRQSRKLAKVIAVIGNLTYIYS